LRLRSNASGSGGSETNEGASCSTCRARRFPILPTWDATLLVHARRAGILPEQYRPRIFHTKAPHSFSTFLVDGAVAGTWRCEDSRVKLDPFERLSRATRTELEEEAERLAAFHA
jgi:Winged helix DNA-binding domain